MSRYDVIVVGAGAGGSVCAYRSADPDGWNKNTLLLESGRDWDTDEEREKEATQNFLADAAGKLHNFPIDSCTTYLGGVVSEGAGAVLSKGVGNQHHYMYAIWGRPEDYAEWDKLLRVKRTFIGVLEWDGINTLTSATIDLTAALANNDWIRFEGEGVRIHGGRFEITARAGTGPWTATVDLHGEPAPMAGVFRIWKCEEDLRLLTSGGGTWVWNGTTTLASGGGGSATTQLKVGDAIYLGSDAGGVNGDPAHFRVAEITDDNTVVIENPLGLTIPSATGATYIASPWSYACVHHAYRSTENDIDHGDGVLHGDSGLHHIGRIGLDGFGEGRPGISNRINPQHELIAGALTGSALGTGVYAYSTDHNSWAGLATITGDIAKSPLDNIAFDTLGNPVAGADGISNKTWPMDKYVYRKNARETFIKAARGFTNLTISENSPVEKILFDKSVSPPKAIGVKYKKLGHHGWEEKVAYSDNIIIAAAPTNTPLLIQRSGIGAKDRLAEVGLVPFVELKGVGDNALRHVAGVQVWVMDTFLEAQAPVVSPIYNVFSYISRTKSGADAFRSADEIGVGVPPTKYDSDFDVHTTLLNGRFPGFWVDPTSDGIERKQGMYTSGDLVYVIHFNYKPRSRGRGVYITSLDPLDTQQPTVKSELFTSPTNYDDACIHVAANDYKSKLTDPALPEVSGALLDLPSFSGVGGVDGYVRGLAFDSTTPFDSFTNSFASVPPVPVGLPWTGAQDDPITGHGGSNILSEFWQHNTGPLDAHFMGTMAMGADDDPWSVLDERARLRGVTGVRIADTSILPTSVRANTFTPSTAHAWRIMDLIIDDGNC